MTVELTCSILLLPGTKVARRRRNPQDLSSSSELWPSDTATATRWDDTEATMGRLRSLARFAITGLLRGSLQRGKIYKYETKFALPLGGFMANFFFGVTG